MIKSLQKFFSALFSKISIRVRIAGFFMVLGCFILSVFSGTALLFLHQSWVSDEKDELLEYWNNFQEEDFDKDDFFDQSSKISGKKINTSGEIIFSSKNFPTLEYSVVSYNETEEMFFFAKEENDENSKNIKNTEIIGKNDEEEYLGIRKKIPDSDTTLILLTSVSDYRKQEESFFFISLILIALSSFLLFGIGYWFALSLLRPLRKISHDSKKISLTNLSHRLAIAGPKNDEIRILSENLNDMFARIENSATVLKQFTQDASHELKTPLAIIDTSLQLAIKTGNIKKVEESREELKNLEKLLESLLLLAQHEEKIFADSEKLEIFLKPEINQIIQKISPHFAEKNISILFDISSQSKILAEKESFSRILWNVMWNAFKFCAENGNITVQFSGKILKILNTGKISEKNLSHIFTRFFRGDVSKSSDGTGIGLALVKTFVEANGGKISAHSSKNTVTFRIDFS